jgi:hypothetical protein
VAFGPGDEGYVQQLKAYDDAFAAFFIRLAAHGITKDNTLFVFTVDEGDHFVGVQKTDCDGVTTPCLYGANEVGEINANIDTLVSDQFFALGSQFLGSASPNAFTVHGDDAPPFYLAKKGSGPLSQTDPLTRQFERDIAKLSAVNPYTGAIDNLMVRMADQTGMKALHMIAAGDPARNATFVLFADPDYFLTDFPASTCRTCINPAFAWNHGDIQPEIAQTWLGFVGPGVRHLGATSIWTDHADVRPTMLSLLGLRDDYVHDGRTVIELAREEALPQSLRTHSGTLLLLGNIYKQVNAPFGQFAKDLLGASTSALRSGSDTDDTAYNHIESEIRNLTDQRDALVLQIRAALDGAAFHGHAINDPQALALIEKGAGLLIKAHLLRELTQ